MLDERKLAVLRAIVEDYVSTTEPVGSKSLVDRHGLDVSPAVREYLGLENTDLCDWKFVDLLRVPSGPWTVYGENNIFSRLRRPKTTTIAVSQRGKPPF